MSPRRRRTGGPQRLPGHDRVGPPSRERPISGPLSASEPTLLRAMKQAVRADHPLDLLALASSLLDQFDDRNQDPFGDRSDDQSTVRDEFVTSLIEVDAATTTALMTAMATLAEHDLAARLEAVMRERRHRLPRWLDHLTPLLVEDAFRITDVLHQSENWLVGVRTVGEQALTVGLLVNLDLGGIVTDLVVMPDQANVVREQFDAAPDRRDLVIDEVDPADLRAVVTEAIDSGARSWPQEVTEAWPAGRPLVEWVLGALPAGGSGRSYVQPDPDGQQRLIDEFMASPEAVELRSGDDEVADWLTWFRTGYANGNPHQWGPPSVELLLLDWVPRKIVGGGRLLRRVPEVLSAHVRWGHRMAGIRGGLTDEVLAVVDELTDDYLDIIARPRAQGPAALMEAMGITPVGPDEDLWLDELAALGIDDDHRGFVEQLHRGVGIDPGQIASWHLPSMAREVGGPDALASLDPDPLPDERLDLAGVADDVHERVMHICELVDEACGALVHVEERTAARRLLADIARRDPALFRRRSSDRRLAAAIMWVVIEVNHGFEDPGVLAVNDLVNYFDVTSTLTARARTLLAAIGVQPGDLRQQRLALGTPRYLVGERRSWMVHQYELAQTWLTDSPG